MIKNYDVIDRLPYEFAAILQADEFFADVPVIVAEKGNVALEMAQQQAVITSRSGKRGVAVVIPQLIGDDEMPEVKFGPLTLKPAVQILENVELNNDSNGTKKSYRKVMRRVIQIGKAMRLDGMTTDWTCDKPAFEPMPFKDAKGQRLAGVVGGQVNFLTRECDTEPLEQVSPPQIALDGNGNFTIACATDGATIYYTTDDSLPVPLAVMPGTNSESTAVLYAEPVPIPAGGCIVRAAAFKSGLIGSTISRAEIEAI